MRKNKYLYIIIILMAVSSLLSCQESNSEPTPSATITPIPTQVTADHFVKQYNLPAELKPVEISPNPLPTFTPRPSELGNQTFMLERKYLEVEKLNLDNALNLNDILNRIYVNFETKYTISLDELEQIDYPHDINLQIEIIDKSYVHYYTDNHSACLWMKQMREYGSEEDSYIEYDNSCMVFKLRSNNDKLINFFFSGNDKIYGLNQKSEPGFGISFYNNVLQFDFASVECENGSLLLIDCSDENSFKFAKGEWFYLIFSVDDDANIRLALIQKNNYSNNIIFSENFTDLYKELEYMKNCDWGVSIDSWEGNSPFDFDIGESYILNFTGYAD